MLATLALFTAVSAAQEQAQDRVMFAHKFEKGTTANYSLEFRGNTPGGDIVVKGDVLVTFGEVKDKKTPATIKTKSFSADVGGTSQGEESPADLEIKLDEHGMSDTFSMKGMSGILVLPFVLGYLPNQNLGKGGTYDFKYKFDEFEIKGTGVFEGSGEVNGKPYPKLKVKSELTPATGESGELEYTVLFDPAAGRILEVKGTAKVESQEFAYLVTYKSK